VGVALSGSAVTSISEGASLEQKVEFLLRRDQEAQQRKNEHAARLNAIEGETPKRLEDLRSEMELHVAEALAAAHGEYLELRVFGAGLLTLGVFCVTAANFV
jgi:hypothetical protein